MLFLTLTVLAMTNLPSFAVSVRPAEKSATPGSGEEGHTRVFSMASAPTGSATPSMVPHYIGNGVVAHIPADAAANITWMDKNTGEDISRRSTACSGLECAAGVYICSKENFKGSCYWQQAGGGACHPYNYDRSSSFGVDMNLQCALFQDNDCLYNQYTDITWPGLDSLWPWPYTWWNGPARSYKCRPCVGCIYGKAPGWVIN